MRFKCMPGRSAAGGQKRRHQCSQDKHFFPNSKRRGIQLAWESDLDVAFPGNLIQLLCLGKSLESPDVESYV